MGKMHKSIILLSLLLSLPAFAVGDVERAALVPQRVIPSGGGSTTNTTSLRSISQRGGDVATTNTTTVSDRRASGARNAVSRETSVARTTTSGGGSVVNQRNVDDVNQRSVALRAGNSTGGVGARVGVSPTTVTSSAKTVARGSSIGSVSVSQNTRLVDASSVAAVKANMESLSELKDSCKSSYYSCMDNFCNSLSEEMGRCACNKSIKNYTKVQDALAAATSELQDVAQRIQYLGLTPNEITTLFTETEAETTLGQQVDNSKIKNDLERIRNMIVGVKSGSASASVTESSGISLDLSNLLSFNIDSSGFDISGMFGTTTQNTSSISNQRGEALYKSAVARCKSAVLTQCSAYGIDAASIINSYDVEIDKDCILYERKLTDENTAMLSTIRNAKTVLQKARLMVAQQKNQYDLRGCISALDSCMQDDFVCGTDYEECLDPTGKYIVDGNVVVGSMPGVARGVWNGAVASGGLYTVWNYDDKNIYANDGSYTAKEYINATIGLNSAKNNAAADISTLLQNRMGWHDNDSGRNYGMCVSILNKCQKHTYDKDGNYLADNTVISSWLEIAFRKIKQSQDRVLMDYAQNCLGEVSNCLTQNNFGVYASTSGTNPADMAIRACLSVINTCRSVTMGLDTATVSTGDLSDIYVWLDAGIATTYQSECVASGGTWMPKVTDTYDGSCLCGGSGLKAASNTNNKYCVCENAGYEWSGSDQACIDPDASSSDNNNDNSQTTNAQVTITLNKNGGTSGASAVYTVRNIGVYKEDNHTNAMGTNLNCVTVPTKSGFTFQGYYGNQNGTGDAYIGDNGCITSMGLTEGKSYTSNQTWYAKWGSVSLTPQQVCQSFSGEWDSDRNACHCRQGKHWDRSTETCEDEWYICVNWNGVNTDDCGAVWATICENLFGALGYTNITICKNEYLERMSAIASADYECVLGGRKQNNEQGIETFGITSNELMVYSALQSACGVSYDDSNPFLDD